MSAAVATTASSAMIAPNEYFIAIGDDSNRGDAASRPALGKR
jgi:hypothetical protein